MRHLLLAFLLLFSAGHALAAADYEREQKWAGEIKDAIVVGDPVYLEQKNGHKFLTIYTEAPEAKNAVVLVHGMGVHPDWGLIGQLRQQLVQQGYTTLSVQMPVLAADAKPEAYAAVLPEADERLQAALDFLKAKGYARPAVVSHSMGTRMTDHFLAVHPDASVQAWVAIGNSLAFQGAGKVHFPILDLYGQNDLPAVLQTAKARAAAIRHHAGSRQVAVPRADHFFTGQDAVLLRTVTEFLDKYGRASKR